MKNFTKKILFSLLFALVGGISAKGQAITITAADMPVPAEPYNLDNITALATSPTIASNGTWDFGSSFGNTPTISEYYPESIPFFTNAGVDAYRLLFKNLNPGFGYELYQEIDFNNEGVDDIAVDIVGQFYTLQPFTGNINDSLFIPAQSYIYDQPRRFIEFPFTANSAWSSSSRRTTDMVINVPAFGLNYADLQHAYTWVRQDTILGFGKMRVYTADGPSIEYDVLMDRIGEYAQDSFYLNGAPAPTPLLTAFGVSQGQKTEETYRYSFYRKGSFGYLATFYYADDETYGNLVSAFVATDDIETQGPSAVVESLDYATVLYPNPSNGSEINLQIMGKQLQLGSYRITDEMGRTVQQGQPILEGNNTVKLTMNSRLSSGSYQITLMDNQLRTVLTERFHVVN